MVDGLQFVPWQAAAVGRIDQADVTLRASLEKSFFIDLVVNTYEPSILVDSRRGRRRQIVRVDIVVLSARILAQPLESGIWIYEAR